MTLPEEMRERVEAINRHIMSALYERHDAFKGYDKNPFTGEKRALQSPCPHCRISPKSLEDDIRNLIGYEVGALLEEADRKAREDELSKAHDQSLSTDRVFSYLTQRILELRQSSSKESK